MKLSIEPEHFKYIDPKDIGDFEPQEVSTILDNYWNKYLVNELENHNLEEDRVKNYILSLLSLMHPKSKTGSLEDNAKKKQKERILKSFNLHKTQLEEVNSSIRSLPLKHSRVLELTYYLLYGNKNKFSKELKFKSLHKGCMFTAKLLCLLGLDNNDSEENQKFLSVLSQLDNPEIVDEYKLNLLNDRAMITSQSLRKKLKDYDPFQTEGFYKGFALSSTNKVIKISNVTKSTNN
ncbi:MAG: hypothetical protein CME63_04630 [Halobacteriovoraceae bacterium]|nr:hypothetical protein [Halobacteriovoraceae bacterium]|tara:strand:- start:37925 stop:38629 length:705 start_codon:yes stop_codon:yes gene_type:complete